MENLKNGQLIEQTSCAAMIEEIQERVPWADGKVIMPQVATTIAWPGDLDANQQIQLLQIQEEVKDFLAVGVFVWAQNPSHYTLLLAEKPQHQFPDGSPQPWAVRYMDPLKPPAPTSHVAAQKIAQRLGFIGPDQLLPMPINARHQIDGWSCGIWVARFWEECVRQRRGEPGCQCSQ